jgi:16S rRNA (uracil1498-N3)-methyltransferase
MHRAFHDEPEFFPDQELTLSPEESRHITQSLRLGPGQEIELFNGKGHVGRGVLISSTKARDCVVQMAECHKDPPSDVRITLAQVLPRTSKFEWILQKAAELGVHTIVPLLGENSVARPAQKPTKAERWEHILISACKQSGNNFVPELAPIQSVADFLEQPPDVDLPLIASLQDHPRPLWEWVEDYRSQHGSPHSAMVMIGPEGDFSVREYDKAREAGVHSLSLTETVLRSETAAIHAVSLLVYELNRQRSLAAKE